MAALKRNATFLSLAGFLSVALCAIWWTLQWNAPPAQAAAILVVANWQTPVPLDPVTAASIDTLRRENGMDDEILSTLNLSTEQLNALLAGLRSWHEQNTADLTARRRALTEQRTLIRTYQAAINNGQDATSQLTAARQQLASLEAAYETFLTGCRTSVLAGLSEGQRSVAEAMRSRRSLPMPYRVLSLTTQQEKDLRLALLRYEQRRSHAHDGERQAAALETFVQERDAALGATHLQTLAGLRTYLPESSTRLVAAINHNLAIIGDQP